MGEGIGAVVLAGKKGNARVYVAVLLTSKEIWELRVVGSRLEWNCGLELFGYLSFFFRYYEERLGPVGDSKSL